MNTLSLSLDIPIDESFDVIVIGGGPAGCASAAAAAREGAKTLLIESSGGLGGSGTTALVPAWCPFSDKEKIIYRGLTKTKVKPEGLIDVSDNIGQRFAGQGNRKAKNQTTQEKAA